MGKFKQNEDSVSRHRIRLRLRIFDILGKECVCCGEKHPLLLTFDHINDDGGLHRKGSCPSQVLTDILLDPNIKENYQVMCISCNQAKYLYGTCPHKSGLTIEETYEGMKQRSALRRSGGARLRTKTSKSSRICGARWILHSIAFPVFYKRFGSVQ
jgi:hypothetical protein